MCSCCAALRSALYPSSPAAWPRACLMPRMPPCAHCSGLRMRLLTILAMPGAAHELVSPGTRVSGFRLASSSPPCGHCVVTLVGGSTATVVDSCDRAARGRMCQASSAHAPCRGKHACQRCAGVGAGTARRAMRMLRHTKQAAATMPRPCLDLHPAQLLWRTSACVAQRAHSSDD